MILYSNQPKLNLIFKIIFTEINSNVINDSANQINFYQTQYLIIL